MRTLTHVQSLLGNLPDKLSDEYFEPLLKTSSFRLERIVSLGHSTPAGEWYDQSEDEWIALIQGCARLILEGQSEEMTMRPGDMLLIPAHCRHRVTWTDPEHATVWVALHFRPDTERPATLPQNQ